MSPKGDKEGKGSTMGEVVTCKYTINLHKRLYRIGFKYQAPRAVKEIKKFAEKTSFESIPDTNKQIWSQGVRNVSFRVRVSLARLKNQDEDSVHKLYTLVNVAAFKGLQTENVETTYRLKVLNRFQFWTSCYKTLILS